LIPRSVALISSLILFMTPQVAHAVDVGVLLGPIFSIFRSDLTAIVITFGLPVIAVAVVMDFRYRVFNPLKEDINFANQCFAGASDPQSYAEIHSDVEKTLNENRFLEPIWSEFKETMGEGKSASGQIIFQNTKRPKDYFTADAIARHRGSLNGLDYLPNIFVGVGLLVTFLGLTAAVYETSNAISQAGSDIDGVLKSVRNLLTVASIKFLTSVAGILCSIGLTFSIKSMQSDISGRLNQLHDRIENCLEFLSLERLQLKTIDAIENMSTSISKGVADGVQGIAGNELRLFADEMRSISSTLKSAGKDIETFGETYSRQIKQIDEAFESRLEKSGQSMDLWVDNLKTDLEKSSAALKSNLASFAQQVEELSETSIKNNKDAYAGIQQSIDNATASFETAANFLSEKLTDQIAVSENYQSSVAEMVEALTHNSENFSKAAEDSLAAIEANKMVFEVGLKRFNEEVATLRDVLEQQKNDLQQITQSISEIKLKHQASGQDREAEIVRLTAKLAELTNQLDRNLGETTDKLHQSFEPLVTELAKLSNKLDKAGNGDSAGVFSRFFRG
jgi:hypothetical protein